MRLWDKGVPVVGRRVKLATGESGFSVVEEHGGKGFTTVPYEQGTVVGEELGGQAEAQGAGEEPQGSTSRGDGCGRSRSVGGPVTRAASKSPPLEVDAAIDEGVNEIADKLGDETDEGQQVEGAKNDRVVAIDRRLKAEEAETVERKDDLRQQGAGKEDAHEGGRENRR